MKILLVLLLGLFSFIFQNCSANSTSPEDSFQSSSSNTITTLSSSYSQIIISSSSITTVSSSSENITFNSSSISSSSMETTISSSSSLATRTCTYTEGTPKGTLECIEKTYSTVLIGSQIWMAENLAWLPSVHSVTDYSYGAPRYHIYGYDGTDLGTAKMSTNYSLYGVLYNWSAAITACPAGWHLPSDEEWATLINTVGGEQNAGASLKSTSGWSSGYDTELDSYGFAAMPGGEVDNEQFINIKVNGYFWSSTVDGGIYALYRTMNYEFPNVSMYAAPKLNAKSVRCLLDK